MFHSLTLTRTTFRCRPTAQLLTTLLLLVAALASGCHSTPPAGHTQNSPPAKWLEWQQQRLQSIAGPNGWTTLVSRYWLPEGTTFAGADPTNQLVLPAGHAPAFVGVFSRQGNSVHFQAAPGGVATLNGVVVHELEMKSDVSDAPTKLVIGSLSILIIDRSGRLGVRVLDPDSPTRHHFPGLQFFSYDPAWQIAGRFEAFPATRTLRVPDASGGIQELTSPGALVFSHDGQEYRLDVAEESGEDEYFVIFTDRTAGQSTYEAGRFLYVARPDATGQVTIDFNRAFTPPCGFTPFATCPRPPPQNSLPFPIAAGERKPVETF
jgi:hypothetical protein